MKKKLFLLSSFFPSVLFISQVQAYHIENFICSADRYKQSGFFDVQLQVLDDEFNTQLVSGEYRGGNQQKPPVNRFSPIMCKDTRYGFNCSNAGDEDRFSVVFFKTGRGMKDGTFGLRIFNDIVSNIDNYSCERKR